MKQLFLAIILITGSALSANSEARTLSEITKRVKVCENNMSWIEICERHALRTAELTDEQYLSTLFKNINSSVSGIIVEAQAKVIMDSLRAIKRNFPNTLNNLSRVIQSCSIVEDESANLGIYSGYNASALSGVEATVLREKVISECIRPMSQLFN